MGCGVQGVGCRYRCPPNIRHTRQSRPDSGPGFQVKVEVYHPRHSTCHSPTSPHQGWCWDEGAMRANVGCDVAFTGQLAHADCRVSVSGIGFRIPGFGFRVSGLRSRVSDLGFQDSGFGFQVSGCGSRVSGLPVVVLVHFVELVGFACERPRRRQVGVPRS